MLDPAFKFSQHSMSDFVECPRRFYLKYVDRQPWPLVETGPLGLNPLEYQAYLWRGVVLHRWIERYWLGVPPQASDDAELNVWWARFMRTSFDDLPATRMPELALVAPLGSPQKAYSLYARFDLLATQKLSDHPERVEGDQTVSEQGSEQNAPAQNAPRAVIVDWKTLRGERPPRYQVFATRLQTRIYLYVLATAGAAFNDGLPFTPEQCRMRYWLANFPEQPWVDIPYSTADYERDQSMLLKLMDSAAQREGEEQYEMTADERRCTYCTYLTLCKRKGAPAESQATEQWLDIEAIGELDY
jgi:PD-(D/E)XK nuclease superfamily